MTPGRLGELGILNLAHVGDAVYDLLVRRSLALSGPLSLHEQHRRTVAMVTASAQADALAVITPLLTPEERGILRRGRNARVHGVPGGCTVAQYHAATALEALFGWLWLRGDQARAEALFEAIYKEVAHAP